MKTRLVLVALLMMGGLSVSAQNTGENNKAAQKEPLPGYSKLSLYAGYSKHGINVRLDLQIADRFFNESSTRFYLELGGQGITFDQPNFNFDGVMYPSDCRIITLGGGLVQEFLFKNRFSIMPFIGLRNEYVRFKSQELVDAIGNGGLQRYADNARTIPVGPVVNNAYGDASAFDIGSRIGIRFGKLRRFELSATIGYSPIHFNTADTLFGQYWGEAPHPNQYWVNRNPVRFELALRINFGSK